MGSRASLFFPIALVGLTAGAGAGCTDGAAAPRDGGAVFSYEPVAAETLAPSEVAAGELISPTCLLLDEDGTTFAPPPGVVPTLRWSPADSVEPMGIGARAIVAGDVEVSCSFPTLLVGDDTPALVHIRPGPPALVHTEVEPRSLEAGRGAEARCEVYDAYGNVISDAMPTLSVLPTDGTTITDLSASFTRSGVYDVACVVPGAESDPAQVEVVPARAANLVFARVPDAPVYAIGQVVEVRSIVTDRYGNPIADVPVSMTSTARESARLGENRFRYDADGRYVVTGFVEGPTEAGRPVTATTEIVVNGNGPSIRCESPGDGSMIDLAPGTRVTFRGAVDDASGVRTVRVNGGDARLEDDGSFSADIMTVFGINFVDIAAVDTFGAENSRTCAFLLADQWAGENEVRGDTIALRLSQEAIDDASRTDGLDSLNDILSTMVNSSGLRSTLHSSLLSANPIKPNSCDVDTFLGCVVRSEINYVDSRIDGPHTTSLTLVDGGIRANVSLRGIHVQLRLSGTFSSTGWVNVNAADVAVIFDTRLVGGRPRITVRPGSVSVTISGLSTDFSGLSGAIIDIVVSVANGTIRNMISGALRDFVADNFNDVLDGLVSSLDVESLGTRFDVPRLDGSGSIPLSFGLGFSTVSATPARLLFGLGTRLSTPAAHARPSLGIPLPPGDVLLDASGARPAAVAVSIGLLNQALHALWRGGLLDADVGGGGGLGLPDGTTVVVRGALPPVARAVGDRVELALGALSLDISYPGLFTNLQVALGARATTTATLVGEDIVFSAITIDQLYFSTGSVTVDASTRGVLEDLLRSLVQSIVDSSLNDALPAIPIPSFTLPSSVATFGLPAGAELGVTSPELAIEPRHVVLRGGFGVR